jgi:hypothetical protein
MGAWQRVAMDFLKFHPGPPCSTLPHLAASPVTALMPFQGWPAPGVGGLELSSSLLDTPHRTPMDVTCMLTVRFCSYFAFLKGSCSLPLSVIKEEGGYPKRG